MAIYQYYLAVLPKEGILINHHKIPPKINVSSETDFFEYNAEFYWKTINNNTKEITSKIDLIIQKANWGNSKTSYNWKTNSDKVDNDVFISLDEKTYKINEFSFRTDLREKELKFLKSMIQLAKENNWFFMDRYGKIINPDFQEIKKNIANSDAYNFLKNPTEFLDNLDKKNEQNKPQ